MPFDARLILDDSLFDDNLLDEGAEDDSTELELPAELAELAGQLSGDALRLAALFPPRQEFLDSELLDSELLDSESRATVAPRPALAEVSTNKHSDAKKAIVATSLTIALAAVLSVPLAMWMDRSGDAPSLATDGSSDGSANVRPLSQHDLSRSIAEIHMGETKERGLEEFLRTPTMSPVLLLQEASGPEIEGLLDLLEGGGDGKTTLSI